MTNPLDEIRERLAAPINTNEINNLLKKAGYSPPTTEFTGIKQDKFNPLEKLKNQFSSYPQHPRSEHILFRAAERLNGTGYMLNSRLTRIAMHKMPGHVENVKRALEFRGLMENSDPVKSFLNYVKNNFLELIIVLNSVEELIFKFGTSVIDKPFQLLGENLLKDTDRIHALLDAVNTCYPQSLKLSDLLNPDYKSKHHRSVEAAKADLEKAKEHLSNLFLKSKVEAKLIISDHSFTQKLKTFNTALAKDYMELTF